MVWDIGEDSRGAGRQKKSRPAAGTTIAALYKPAFSLWQLYTSRRLKSIAGKEGTMGLIIVNTVKLVLQIAILVLLVKIWKEK